MTFQEQHEINGIEETLGVIVKEMGRQCWNAVVWACEDAANTR